MLQTTIQPLVEVGPWKAVEMTFTLEKTKWLWDQMRRYRTLFSDLTRGDAENFYNLITRKDSVWLEVLGPNDEIVGIVYWTGLNQVIDVDVHLMFFDRMPAEKAELCRQIAKWFFTEFPQCNRMTATLPVIYHATLRLADKIGFKREGRKRQSQVMGGKMIDELMFGLLAKEVM